MITPAQTRAAMGMLQMKQQDLAQRLGVKSRGSVADFLGSRNGRAGPIFAARIQAALEQAGVEFIPGGVRAAKSKFKGNAA